MIDEPPGRFLMTSAQHRQWARIVRKRGRPDLAFHHEELARVIEQQAEHSVDHTDEATKALLPEKVTKPEDNETTN